MKTIQYYLLLCASCVYLSACTGAETKRELHLLEIVGNGSVKVSYQVEIADTTDKRLRGLMYRKELPVNQGMLLDYDIPGERSIWMKNTYVPLDIIFVDTDGVIVKIHEGAVPLSLKSIGSEVKVKAVLEINAGQVKEHAIQVGDRVNHPTFGN